MRAVRNIVDTGRTVVTTIHQPSIDIFEARARPPTRGRGARLPGMRMPGAARAPGGQRSVNAKLACPAAMCLGLLHKQQCSAARACHALQHQPLAQTSGT